MWPDRYKRWTDPPGSCRRRRRTAERTRSSRSAWCTRPAAGRTPAGRHDGCSSAPGRAAPALDSGHGQDREASSADERTVEDRIEELRRTARGGAARPAARDAAEKQHDKGKLTARERLDILMDAGSFVETDPFAVHRSHDFGMDDNAPAGRRRRHRLRHDRRPQGVRRLAGLHGVRRLDGRGRTPRRCAR